MEFSNINQIEKASAPYQNEMMRLGVGLFFMVGIMFFVATTTKGVDGNYMLIIAALIGGYMAMNIGANDVANNVGPAVGSQALTLTGAILIAAIFEGCGALIAGGDVVSTIQKGIINPELIRDDVTFIWLMMAALTNTK